MRRLFLVLVLTLCACAHVPPSPTAVLDEAAGRAKNADAPARTLSLAAFHALLVENQPERARTLAQDALRRDAGEPYALAAEEALARRDGHPEMALDAALRLVRAAPKHLLATLAARQIHDIAGLASSLDARILAEAPRALADGASGETAVLLRQAMAQLQFLHERPELAETRAATGVPGEVTLLGPLSPLHLLGFGERTEPERTGEIPGTLSGPFGPVTPAHAGPDRGKAVARGGGAERRRLRHGRGRGGTLRRGVRGAVEQPQHAPDAPRREPAAGAADVRAARVHHRRAGGPPRARRASADGRPPQGGAHGLPRLHHLARRRAALRRALLGREGAGAALERGEGGDRPRLLPRRGQSRGGAGARGGTLARDLPRGEGRRGPRRGRRSTDALGAG